MRCEESGKGFESGLVSRNRQKGRGTKKGILKQARYRAKRKANYCDECNYTVLFQQQKEQALK